MIGKKIRSVHHLLSKLKNRPIIDAILITDNNDYRYCKVIKYGDRSVLIFNNFGGDNVSCLSEVNISEDIYNEFHHYFHIRKICELNRLGFSELIYVDFDIKEEVRQFVSSNKKLIGSVVDKYNLNQSSLLYLFYIIGDGKPNYIQWMINTYINAHVPINIFRIIMSFVNKYGNEVKKLSKGTVTAYTKREQIIGLLKEISELKINKSCNDVINSFNTAQKKILKSTELNIDDKKNLCKFKRLAKEKQINFIKKASTFDNTNEILKYISFLVKDSFKWDKNSVIEYMQNIDGIKYNIILDVDNIILFEALDYEAIKLFGKTTNWCISKNKKYWNDYIGKHNGPRQFVLFDFNQKEDSEYSIIGFTISDRIITHAHSFTNADIKKSKYEDNYLTNLRSFLKYNKQVKNVTQILNSYNISIDNIIGEQNGENLNDVLNCLCNFHIISITKDWCILLTDFDNARKIGLKKDVMTSSQFIFFLKLKNNCVVTKYFNILDNESSIGICKEMLFDMNIRITNVSFFKTCFESCIRYTDIPGMKPNIWAVKLFEFGYYDEAISLVKSCNNNITETSSFWYSIIKKSLLDYFSFDLVKLLYDNDIKLCDLMEIQYITNIFDNMYHMFDILNTDDMTDAEFESLLNKPYSRFDNCCKPFKYIINKIIERENNVKLYESLIFILLSKSEDTYNVINSICILLNKLLENNVAKLDYSLKKSLVQLTSMDGGDKLSEQLKNFQFKKSNKKNESIFDIGDILFS